jgi:hypothetical protein
MKLYLMNVEQVLLKMMENNGQLKINVLVSLIENSLELHFILLFLISGKSNLVC